jgi:hypothetical protein
MSQPASLKNITQPKSKAKPNNQLQALWQQIEKHQKRNAAFKKKVADNYQLFKQQVLPDEQTQVQFIGARVEHLTSFLTRKSLSNAERRELAKWITQEMDYLEHHPFKPQGMFERLNETVMAQLNILQQQALDKISDADVKQLRADLNEEFAGQLNLSDRELKEILIDPSRIYPHLDALDAFTEDGDDDFCSEDQANAFDQDDFDEEDFDDAFFDDFYRQYQQHHEQDAALHQARQNQLDRLFKGSQLNKMYKRLASKLHPDKELDPQTKHDKHQQMQALAEARQHKDGFTILQLYLQHFDDDPSFDQDTLNSLLPLLEEKLHTLNIEYQELQNNDRIETLVWHKFKARSKKQIQQNMQDHCVELQTESQEMDAFIRSCSTVKNIKGELRRRLNEEKFNPFDDFDLDSLGGLFRAPF